MSLSMLLLWFPIVLAVGVAGRLLGRGRGLAFGFLCSLFWVSLVFAIAGVGVSSDPWSVAAIVAGVATLTLVGGWSHRGVHGDLAIRSVSEAAKLTSGESVERRFLSSIEKALGRFDEWTDETLPSNDPWADFGEYLRSVLSDALGATHVHPYRVVGDGAELEPLHGAGLLGTKSRVTVGDDLIGRVLATDVSFVAGVDQCEDEIAGTSAPAWCFAVTRGRERLGVISVGTLDVSPAAHPEAARAMERLVGEVWSVFVDKLEARSASVTDSASTLGTRDAFMRDANIAIRESYSLGEPVAIAVLAVQGLRSLTDAGRWEVADDVLHTIGGVMRQKVRLDDCVGRIDESRVVWFLRRVDMALAKLVVGQLVSHVDEAIRSCPAAAGSVRIDCGVSCSGPEDVALRALLVQALDATSRARVENRLVFFEGDSGQPATYVQGEAGGGI